MALTKIPLSLLGSLVFFVIFWSLGFPQPHIDDLSYIGAGLNLAQGGDFSDPFLAREFSEHYAFFYPPIHSFVLAGWLKVFGISSVSLTGFQMMMYLLCAGSAIFILRKHQSPVWLEWLAPLAVANAFLTDGLRPEPFAAALIMTGFAIIECGARNKILVFLAFLLMSLGGGTAPRMTLYAMALILYAAWQLCGPVTQNDGKRWAPLGLLLAAGLLAGVIFLAMIDFKLSEFWGTFHQNSQRLAGVTLASFVRDHFSYTQAAIVVLFAIAAFLVLRQPSKDGLTRISIVIAAAFPIEIAAKFSGYGASRWYALLICLFLAGSISKRLSAFWKAALQSGLAIVLVLLNLGIFVNVAGIVSGRIQNTKSQESLLASVPPGQTVLIDCAAARYYFDYRIPKGCIDFTFSLPFPYETPLDGTRPGDIFLIGPDNVDLLKRGGVLDYQPMTKWSPLGISKLSFYEHPQQVFLIFPAMCKGLPLDASH